MGSWMVIVVVVVALVHSSAAQTSHTVGDTTGWRIPPSGGAQFYVNWTSSKTFMIGDILIFNFTATQHDVAEVSKTNFDNCGTSNTIGSIITTSPASITLNMTGEHYYICTINGHCAAGQKLAINVTSSNTNTNTNTTTPSTSAPPPPSAASPLAAGFGIAGISVAILTALFV